MFLLHFGGNFYFYVKLYIEIVPYVIYKKNAHILKTAAYWYNSLHIPFV